MPSRLTIAQLEANTQLELALLRKDIETLVRDQNQFEIYKIRERITALETTVVELKRRKEESDKRNLQFVYIGIGAVFTILVQLVIAWVKK
jgi:hypothetical protein